MYNLEFQKQVLLLFSTNIKFAFEHGDLLKEDYFDSQPHRILLRLISEYIFSYEKEISFQDLSLLIDEYTRKNGFTDDFNRELRVEAKEVYRASVNEKFVIEKFIDYCKNQEFKNALLKSVSMIENGTEDMEQSIRLIEKALTIGAGKDSGLTFNDMYQLPEMYRKQYEVSNLIRTGFPGYDKALGGGMAKGEIHIVQAPAKCGKSTFATNLGTYALMTNKVVYHVSLELPELQVLAKYACRLTGLTYNQILEIDSFSYAEKLKKFDKYKPKLFVKYWTEKSATAMTIRSWAIKQKAATNLNPDLLIIDYDDCLSPIQKTKSDDMYETSSLIYSDLIALAEYLKVPIFILAQPKREGWDKINRGEVVSTTDVAHSYRKVHKCHSISSLNFPDGKDEGILYVDRVRRGTSDVKVRIKKDFSIGHIWETE